MGGISDALRGELDEIWVWNYARNIDQFRSKMCSKISTPAFEGGLMVNIRFDNGNNAPTSPNYANTTLGAALTNVTFTERSSYIVSGAPIGDRSRFVYNLSNSNNSLMDTHSDGDFVAISNLGGGSPDGAHIYWIEGAAHFNAAPVGYLGVSDNKQFGVFMANGSSPSYDLTYKFDGNSQAPGAYTMDQLRLIKKTDASVTRWEHVGAKIDKTSKTLVVLCKETDKAVYSIGYLNDTKRPGAGMALRYRTSDADGESYAQA